MRVGGDPLAARSSAKDALATPLPSAATSSQRGHPRYAPLDDLFTLSPIAETERFTLDMPPTPPPPHLHPMDVDVTPPPAAGPLVSVFDWDDTLCPSSWLHRTGVLAPRGLTGEPLTAEVAAARFAALPERRRQRFAQLEAHVLALLQRALLAGPVFIITAATLQWVEACAERFLPRVRALLAPHAVGGVRVVSAREWYQQHVRREGDPQAWKLATFDALCAHLQLEAVHRQLRHRVDFVSVGDSVFERDACRQVERKAPGAVHAKTLKFVERPSLQELLDQVALAASLYERIRSHAGSLDLHVTRHAQRQKGGPTLRIVQVDLSNNQETHDAWAKAGGAGVTTTAAAAAAAAAAAPAPVPSFHARSRALHTASRFAMDAREMGASSRIGA
ncbi:hypothetical protein PybrP1_001903 [[Pythium] brassicae (nom. inval.)]|nr:hypothetical protein PybrP1_001903 [[Pythium] brassicae (nom. inval.)]